MKVIREVEESEANVALLVYVKGLISGVPSVSAMTCPSLDPAQEFFSSFATCVCIKGCPEVGHNCELGRAEQHYRDPLLWASYTDLRLF